MALSCWIVLSGLDVVFEARHLPLRGNIAAPSAMRPEHAGLRVAVALSGGGYRAALVHAGVLDELSRLGVPVTNLSSVSGGSIIAAFVSRGGDPEDFVGAVREGRFRFKRELFSAVHVFRWANPLDRYSRRDVQAAGMVRRVQHFAGLRGADAMDHMLM